MWLAIVLASLALAQQAHPAQPPGAGQGTPTQDQSLLSIRQIELASFKPKNLDVEELALVAQNLIGRSFYVVENGGYDSSPVANVHLLGSILVLYDEPEHLKRMLPRLEALDRAGGESADEPAAEYQTWEYGPRYLSLDAVTDMLRPLHRQLYGTSNMSISEEQRLLVVRDTSQRIAEIRGLIERVDVPQDQITIACWLLQGGAQAPSGGALPADLAEHLQRLLPGQAFHPAGFGMLQVTVSTRRPITLQLGPGAQMYQLELQPTAYDRQSGSLTVGSCTLSSLRGEDHPLLFSTSVVLRGGSFTVIGASGAEPTLVAVQVRPVGK